MELSVLHSGNRVRITAELIDARTDQHLWGQSYERDLSDVLMLQSEMAQAIALQVRLKLTPEEQARLQQGTGGKSGGCGKKATTQGGMVEALKHWARRQKHANSILFYRLSWKARP
jgi:hypothetical protein